MEVFAVAVCECFHMEVFGPVSVHPLFAGMRCPWVGPGPFLQTQSLASLNQVMFTFTATSDFHCNSPVQLTRATSRSANIINYIACFWAAESCEVSSPRDFQLYPDCDRGLKFTHTATAGSACDCGQGRRDCRPTTPPPRRTCWELQGAQGRRRTSLSFGQRLLHHPSRRSE